MALKKRNAKKHSPTFKVLVNGKVVAEIEQTDELQVQNVSVSTRQGPKTSFGVDTLEEYVEITTHKRPTV